MPELKIYMVKDLREWLTNNHPAEGLSERVIAPTRAWAIIHNPYVMDDDAIVAAIFEDGELAAYTASFPEMLDGNRIWWASTLYCYPNFTGKGYGLIVVGSLMEAHEPDLTYDRWAAKETIEIFNHFGYKTTYTKRYFLSDRKIVKNTLKGNMAYCVQAIQKRLHPWPKSSKNGYEIQYASTIDDEAYAFMKSHRRNDLWLREQKMLNWMMEFPLKKSGKPRVESGETCMFGDEARVYEYQVVKVYVDEHLQGVYVLRLHDDELGVIYLYYTYEKRDVVFDSIIDYIITNRPKSFVMENQYLFERAQGRLYFPKSKAEQISLSLPEIKSDFTMQMGDGDSFV